MKSSKAKFLSMESLSLRKPFAQQLPLVILIGITIIYTAITWGRYGNIHIDFGRELYTAWRISEGDVLYRDIAWFNGPLSQYFNGFLFYIFGKSLNVLYAANLIILIFIIILIYNIVTKLSNVFAAAVTVLFFLPISAFGYITEVGNYNFIAPYSHEMSHGILLLLLSIFFLIRFFERQNLENAFLCGIFVGLSVLTKLEVAAAAVVGILYGFYVIIRQYSNAKEKLYLLFVALLGVVLPVVLAVLLFSLSIPFTTVLENIFIPLRLVMSNQVRNIPIYGFITGFSDVRLSLWIVMWSLVVNICFIAPVFAVKIFTLTKTKDKFWGIPVAILSVLIVFILYLLINDIYKRDIALYFPACWPIILLLSFVILHLRKYKNIQSYPIIISMVLCSFILKLKVPLKLMFSHYGVFFVVTSLMLFMIFIFKTIARSPISFGCKAVYKTYIVVMFFIILFPLVKDTYNHVGILNAYEYKNEKRGNVYLNIHEFMASNILQYVDKNIPKNETVAILPQGAGVNFFTDHVNPTRYITVLPLEIAAFGEKNIIEAYVEHSPDWIVILQSIPGDLENATWLSFIHHLSEHEGQSYTQYFSGDGFLVFKKKI